MTFFLLHDGGKALLATDRPVLKASEGMIARQAMDLLDRAQAWEKNEAERCARAEAEAEARGYREGREEGLRAFAEAIAEIAQQAESCRQTREREIAALALSALRWMIDDIGNADVMAGLARRAAAAVIERGETRVHAAPSLCARITEVLQATEATSGVEVLPDPQLAEHECRIRAGDWRIVADLPRQLATIAERWSVSDGD